MLRRFSLVAVLAISMIFSANQAQGDIISFRFEGRSGFGLRPDNENPGASGSGFGDVRAGIFYDTDTNELTMDFGWGSGNGFSDLTGNATVAHIHGAADFFTNAGVVVGLDNLPGFNNSSTSGGFIGSVTLNETAAANLLAGLLYVNIHTAANPGGELRGNLVAIPEPAFAGILMIGLGIILNRRDRR